MQDKFFDLKFSVKICEAILNLNMMGWTGPCQPGLLWTRWRRAKSRPALPIYHMKSVLFRDITQCRVIVRYQCFRSTSQSSLQWSV